MDSVTEAFNGILTPGSSALSKSIGVAIAAVCYYFLGMVILPLPCCRKSPQARRQAISVLNSLVLTTAYLYSWSLCNPHDGQAIGNTPSSEIPLMLTAGYYVLDLLAFRSILDILHHVISIGAILVFLPEGKGANVGVTFAFLVEVANLLYQVRLCAVQFQTPGRFLLDILYPTVFIFVRVIGLVILSHKIYKNQDLPEVPKELAGLLSLLSFFYCFRMFVHVFGKGEEPVSRRRSRSRTPRVSRKSKKKPSSRISRCGLDGYIQKLSQ